MSRFAHGAAMARLSAADDVAVRDQRARGMAGAARGSLRAFPRARACARSCARKSTWARAPSIALCRDADAARRRDLASPARRQARSGPAPAAPSSPIAATTEAVLARLRAAVDAHRRCGTSFATDWLLLDAEIMPWSAKAGALIESQYAPVAISSPAGLAAASEALARAGRAASPVESAARRASLIAPGGPTRYCTGLGTLCLAGVGRRTTCASRRFICSPARAASGSTRTTSGTCSFADRLAAAGDQASSPHAMAARSRSATTPPRRRHRLVGGADRRGRRGHGGQAARVRRARKERPDSTRSRAFQRLFESGGIPLGRGL